MDHHYLRAISPVALLVIALLAFGCSSKTKGDQPIPAGEIRALDLLQTEDVLLAVRLDFRGMPQASSLLDSTADISPGDSAAMLADLAQDPLQFLADAFDFPEELNALDKNQPGYLLLTHRGNEQFLTASRLGLVTTPEEWPSFLNLRVLLPSKNPADLSSELKSQANEGVLASGLFFEGGDFLRVELALPAEPDQFAAAQANSWLDDLELQRLQPPSSAEQRPTPAYNAFIDEEVQLGIWLPMSSLASLAALEMNMWFRNEYNQVGPAGKPRFHLEGVSRVAASAIAADPVSAENEDIALLLSGQGETTIIVDYITSRTTRGVAIAEAHQTSLELPRINAPEAFLTLNWEGGLANPEAVQIAPRWSFIDDPTHTASFEALTQGGATGILPTDPKASLPELAAFLQYPSTYMTRNLAKIGSGDTVPLVASIKAFPSTTSENPLPIAAALTALFPQNPNIRAQLEQWLAIGQMFLPMAFDAALIERNGLLELRIVLGAELSDIFPTGGPMETMGSTEISLDLLKFQQTLPVIPSQRLGEQIKQIHLTSGDDSRYASYRLVLGDSPPLPALQLEPQVEPLLNPTTRCETDIAALAVEKLRDLRTDAQGQVEDWAQAVESLAGQCVDPANPGLARFIKSRIEMTRQRAQEIP